MHHTIFITGATGNIGGRILKELVEGTDASFKLLVSGKADAAVRDKVSRVLSFWGLAPADKRLADRIEVLRGDIREPELGLDKDTYARIGASITHAIHCAGNIKLNLSIQEARESILLGTRHVIDLCRLSVRRGTFRRFNHFSTMEVAGDMSGIVKEAFLTDVKRRFLNTYEQAKAETEEYLRGLQEEEGFPVTIYRPSMVVGDSETGQALKFGSFYHMINDLFLHPHAPIVPGHDAFIIDTIPVDTIAKTVTLLYDSDESNGHVYQLTSGLDQTLTLPELSRKIGETLKTLTGNASKLPHLVSPRLVWILNVMAYPFTFGTMRKRITINLVFLKFFFLRIRFDNARTRTALAKHGVVIPRLEDYLPTLVKYYLERHVQGTIVKQQVPRSPPGCRETVVFLK